MDDRFRFQLQRMYYVQLTKPVDSLRRENLLFCLRYYGDSANHRLEMWDFILLKKSPYYKGILNGWRNVSLIRKDLDALLCPPEKIPILGCSSEYVAQIERVDITFKLAEITTEKLEETLTNRLPAWLIDKTIFNRVKDGCEE